MGVTISAVHKEKDTHSFIFTNTLLEMWGQRLICFLLYFEIMLTSVMLMQSEHFPFLGVNNAGTTINDMRCRTTFYTALGRLLLVELGEDEERFERFMLPLTGKETDSHSLNKFVNTWCWVVNRETNGPRLQWVKNVNETAGCKNTLIVT